MNKSMWLSFAVSISVVGSVMASASAQQLPGQPEALLPQQQLNEVVQQPRTIPQSTAVIVSFPASVVVDVGQDQDYPLTLPLAQAIFDDQGNLVVPENTPVSVLLKPVDGGVEIAAQSLVVAGQIVPIDAASPMIPGTTVTHMRANDRAVENGAVWGRILGSGFGFMNQGNPDQFDRGAMLGSAVGALAGLRNPENTRIVQIPQGSVYVLSLQAPVVLAAR
ncbi:hypothetical protein IQ268_00500 [Oculatella sp. LEGE 06141]|uniref:hypothetical protein n=1 Tax=Oculatella sp. LEGE 06141 TaxID=1828648 RepID=UPI00187E3B82|nr:hypothetical protein [Oculatella sp. LEGE 06141]MBE9177054.1 hypothetical protein [Oculatella sp. LEGE 06141]